MVTVLSLASARSSTTALSVKGQIRFQSTATAHATIQAATIERMIVLLYDCEGAAATICPSSGRVEREERLHG